MAESQNVQEQNLKKDSINKLDVIIMSVSAAAPAMCLGGPFGTIMQGAGTAVSLAFLLATVVIVMIGLNYGQLSSRYNSAGGTYSYVRSVFGERIGFTSGWIYMGVDICTGVIGAIFATYLHELFPVIPLWAGVLILPNFLCGLERRRNDDESLDCCVGGSDALADLPGNQDHYNACRNSGQHHRKFGAGLCSRLWHFGTHARRAGLCLGFCRI